MPRWSEAVLARVVRQRRLFLADIVVIGLLNLCWSPSGWAPALFLINSWVFFPAGFDYVTVSEAEPDSFGELKVFSRSEFYLI